jgi:hypothetical protein
MSDNLDNSTPSNSTPYNYIDEEIALILKATDYLLTSDQTLIIKKALIGAVFAGAIDSSVVEDAEKSARELGIL